MNAERIKELREMLVSFHEPRQESHKVMIKLLDTVPELLDEIEETKDILRETNETFDEYRTLAEYEIERLQAENAEMRKACTDAAFAITNLLPKRDRGELEDGR